MHASLGKVQAKTVYVALALDANIIRGVDVVAVWQMFEMGRMVDIGLTQYWIRRRHESCAPLLLLVSRWCLAGKLVIRNSMRVLFFAFENSKCVHTKRSIIIQKVIKRSWFMKSPHTRWVPSPNLK